MDKDTGASADADRATRASPEPLSPQGLGHSASVPCAGEASVSREHELVVALEDMTSLAQTMLQLHRLEVPKADEAMEAFRIRGEERVKKAYSVLGTALEQRLSQASS